MENTVRDVYIGIDCGVNTGIAVWSRIKQSFVSVETMTLTSALIKVYQRILCAGESRPVLVVEDPSVWFPRAGDGKKLQGAGSVKRDFGIWKEFCEIFDLEFIPVPAHRRRNTKMSAEAFRAQTGWNERTSTHARDAAMLVWKR